MFWTPLSRYAGPVVVVLAIPLIGPAFAQTVGKVGAVNPVSTGTPPVGSTRTLALGSNVIFKERIRTTATGNLQLIFVDKSTLSIGANSYIIIDEFVYDPNEGTGHMTTSMTKGILRFIGGNISHSGGTTIRTPAGVIGIRGGTGGVEVKPSPQRGCAGLEPVQERRGVREGVLPASCMETEAILYFGRLTVTWTDPTGVPRVDVYTRPGTKVTIPARGAAPTYAKASAADVRKQVTQ